jgi:hypothetical protein
MPLFFAYFPFIARHSVSTAACAAWDLFQNCEAHFVQRNNAADSQLSGDLQKMVKMTKKEENNCLK